MPPTLNELKNNEMFKNLPAVEQKRYMERTFPGYNNLPEAEKLRVLDNINPVSLRAPDPVMEMNSRNATMEEMGIPEKPGFIESAKGELPEAGLATVGAVMGAPGGLPGSVLGAFVGGSASKAIDKTAEYLSNKRSENANIKQDIVDISKTGAKQGMYELVGGSLIKFGNKLLKPATKTLTENAKVAYRTLDKYMPKVRDDKFNIFNPFSWKPVQRGMDMKHPSVLPAEATDNWALDWMHNVSEGAIWGREKFMQYNKMRDQAIGEMQDEMIQSYGMKKDPTVLGNMVVQVARDNWKGYKENITKPLYDAVEDMVKPEIKQKVVKGYVETGVLDANGKPARQVVEKVIDEEVGGVKVSIRELKRLAEPLKKKAEVLQGFGGEDTGDNIVKAVMDLPDEVQFGVAQSLRTRLLDINSKFSVTNKNAQAVRISNQFGEALDKNIETALKKNNTEAYIIWQDAQRLYKEGSQKYNNQFVRKLIRQADPNLNGEPEKVLTSIFRNGGTSGIRKVAAAIGPDNFRMLKRWYIEDLLVKSTPKGEGIAIGKNLKNNMYGRSGMGEEGINAIFTGEERKALDDIATTLEVVQSKSSSGQGGMLIQLMQGGALATGLTSLTGAIGDQNVSNVLGGTSAIILAGPQVMARVMINPIGAKWLTEGLRTPLEKAGTERAAAIMFRLNDIINKTEEKMADEVYKE